MSISKKITISALFIVILICSQLCLSSLAGIEIVTVLFLAYSFYFGIKMSLITATAFSLLRCLVFGFYPTVIILYLIYYNLFGLFFAFVGKKDCHVPIKKHIFIVVTALLFTIFFTLLDCIINVIFYSFSLQSAKAYLYASLTFAIPQCLCVLVTTAFLFKPLINIFNSIQKKQ